VRHINLPVLVDWTDKEKSITQANDWRK